MNCWRMHDIPSRHDLKKCLFFCRGSEANVLLESRWMLPSYDFGALPIFVSLSFIFIFYNFLFYCCANVLIESQKSRFHVDQKKKKNRLFNNFLWGKSLIVSIQLSLNVSDIENEIGGFHDVPLFSFSFFGECVKALNWNVYSK